jgi:hypothetical protein
LQAESKKQKAKAKGLMILYHSFFGFDEQRTMNHEQPFGFAFSFSNFALALRPLLSALCLGCEISRFTIMCMLCKLPVVKRFSARAFL